VGGGWPAKKEGKEKRVVACNTTDTIKFCKRAAEQQIISNYRKLGISSTFEGERKFVVGNHALIALVGPGYH
jgi:hypothetical protein